MAVTTSGTVNYSDYANKVIDGSTTENPTFLQNTPQDTVVGRASPGTGNAQYITCTSAGRALLDDADAAAQRNTLQLDSHYLGLNGGTLTGPLTLSNDAANALEPVTLQQLNTSIAGTYKLQGSYNPTLTHQYPTASNTTNPVSATIKAGMLWTITVQGDINGFTVHVGDQVAALIDNPGQTDANWVVLEYNLGYEPLSTSLNSANLFVGNASNVATGVPLSGDATLSNTGVLTIANGAITSPKVSAGTYGINISGNAATVTTNANLTGDVSSVGNTTTIGASKVTNAMLAGSIADTKLNTLSTAGKVANSATTATPSNTPSMIVSRDASGNFSAGTISAALSGNASTAAALQTPRTINGVSFDGTANITVTAAASTLSGTTLNATVINSSLTGVGTLTSGTWNATKIAEAYGGTNQTTYTIGDMLYSSATNTLAKLAGNITATKKFLSQTGTGTVSAAPSWSTIAASDIPGSALTKSDDTNVTLTLGGSPTTALLNAASLTLGWSGQLSGARGGTGVDNSGKTITLGGNFSTSGAFGCTLTVTGITNVTLPTSGTLATVAGTIASGSAAGGDLSGTYPNPTVSKINGSALGSTTPTAGNIMLGSGTDWVSNPVSGDVTISASGVTAIGASKVTNAMLAGSIADSKLLTISTAGKVANSATTATNANTANAIVARDASGNFTAGTITSSRHVLNNGSTALTGVNNVLNFAFALSTGNYLNFTSRGNVGVNGSGNLFYSANLDYDATAATYKYINSGQACVLELGASGLLMKTAPSGVSGAAVTPTTVVRVNTDGTLLLSGLATNSAQPFFTAYVNALISNVTGGGITYQVIFNTAIKNVGSCYDVSTGVFTAPVTGNYQFSGLTGLNNLGATNTSLSHKLVTTSFTYQIGNVNPSTVRDSNATLSLPWSVNVPLNAGDTVHVEITVSGGTQVVGVRGVAPDSSYFTGFLVA